MSTHDRGAFGALLAEAKALGCGGLEFYVRLEEPDDAERWDAVCYHGRSARCTGRTGEEALRRLVEELKALDARV